MKIANKCSFDRVLSILTHIHTIFTRNRERNIPQEPMTFFWLDIKIYVDPRESLKQLINRLEADISEIFETIAKFHREQKQQQVSPA